MKAVREDVLYTTGSFSAYLFEGEVFSRPYHFHFENEIVLVYKSNGNILVRDQMAEYHEGDIFILGSNMPHSFVCAPEAKHAKSLVIQFNNECFGDIFFQLPEFRAINQMLEKSKYGLRIVANHSKITRMVEKTCSSSGVRSIINLLNLLSELSQPNNIEQISPNGNYTDKTLETHKLNAAIDWLNDNYFRTIKLADIAAITNITEEAFCRSFKKTTGKTFLQYLNDIRVHEAAQKLIETELSITQIAYDVGFSNISSFNRYFKKQKKLSPSEFRQYIEVHDGLDSIKH